MVGTRAGAFSPATLLVRRPRGRTHARTTSYPPSLLGYQVAVLYVGDFFSPSLRPSSLPFSDSRFTSWTYGARRRLRERSRQEGHGKGRETVGPCFAKSAYCSRGTYRLIMQGYELALYKGQLRKVTCRRSLADAVLCLNNASRLLHLSKWQFAVTRCVLELGLNVERE